VLDQAFRRIRELPRAKVAPQLYDLFKTERWKLRRAAAATILAMSTVEHIDEFLAQLSRLAHKNFNLPEAITYGALLGGLKEGNAKKALGKHMQRGNVRARLSAVAYYFEYGTKKDLGALEQYERARLRVPKCDDDGDCDWTCVVGNGKGRSTKEIKTLGDFVKYCVAPQARSNVPKNKKRKKKKKKSAGGKTDAKKGKTEGK
jgi:hypothetical protein